MKVLNFLFDDRYGGPQKRVIAVGRALETSGVETVLVLPQGCGNAEQIARAAGVRVQRVAFERIPSPREPLRVLRWTTRLLPDVVRIRRLLRSERPDVVHVNGAFFLSPALAARSAGVPIIWHLNDTLVPRRAAVVLGRLVRLLANRVAVAAGAVAEHYGVARAPHSVLHAPVDVECFDADARDANSGTGPLRVGLVANWNPLKGHEYFLRAAARVRDAAGTEVRFVLAGQRLESQAAYARRIDALTAELGLGPVLEERGFVPEVQELLRELDVLVLSSISEACPMAVLEAMAAGVPVVAADVGGVREILDEGDLPSAGIVVPSRSPEAMADAILAVLRDRDLAARMGRAGRARAECTFSLQVCARRHLALYRSLLSHESRSSASAVIERPASVAQPGGVRRQSDDPSAPCGSGASGRNT